VQPLGRQCLVRVPAPACFLDAPILLHFETAIRYAAPRDDADDFNAVTEWIV